MIQQKIETSQVGGIDIRIDNLSEQGIKSKKDLINKYKDCSFKVDVDAVWNEIKQFIKKDSK